MEEFKNEPEESFHQRISKEIDIKEFEELFNDEEEIFITKNGAEGNMKNGENDKHHHLVVHDDEEVEIKHHERELKISIAATKIKKEESNILTMEVYSITDKKQ